MSKKVLKDSEFEKIAGGNWKNINKGIEYTTAGIECITGLAILSFGLYCHFNQKNNPQKNYNFMNFSELSNFINNIGMFAGTSLAIGGARRIISQAKKLY